MPKESRWCWASGTNEAKDEWEEMQEVQVRNVVKEGGQEHGHGAILICSRTVYINRTHNYMVCIVPVILQGTFRINNKTEFWVRFVAYRDQSYLGVGAGDGADMQRYRKYGVLRPGDTMQMRRSKPG